MDKLTYEIKITGEDITSLKILTAKTKRFSLKKPIIALLILGICSIVFGFVLYYLLFVVLLVISINLGIKIFNNYFYKNSKLINEKHAENAYKNETITVIFDAEKIIFGENKKYYTDIQRVKQNENLYYFVVNANPKSPRKDAAIIVPKRYVNTAELENFLSTSALATFFKVD